MAVLNVGQEGNGNNVFTSAYTILNRRIFQKKLSLQPNELVLGERERAFILATKS